MKYFVFCLFFNQLQKVLVFNLFSSTCYKTFSLQYTIPKVNSNSINTNGIYPHKITLQYWLLFYEIVIFVLIKGLSFRKMKNVGTVSHPEVISQSPQLYFVKDHTKGPLSQTLVCCYIMALLFLEKLSYCSIREVSVCNNFYFILLCFDLLTRFLNWFLLDWLYYWFYIWIWTRTWRVLSK